MSELTTSSLFPADQLANPIASLACQKMPSHDKRPSPSFWKSIPHALSSYYRDWANKAERQECLSHLKTLIEEAQELSDNYDELQRLNFPIPYDCPLFSQEMKSKERQIKGQIKILNKCMSLYKRKEIPKDNISSIAGTLINKCQSFLKEALSDNVLPALIKSNKDLTQTKEQLSNIEQYAKMRMISFDAIERHLKN